MVERLCHFTHRFAKFGSIALQNPFVPPVALSARLAVSALEAHLRADLAQCGSALREIEVIGTRQQRADVLACEAEPVGMKLIGDASHLCGCVCLSGHRTSRPMFRVLVRNRTAKVRKMVADGARCLSEALQHRAHRGWGALGERGVEYARHFGTIVPASVLRCPSVRRRGQRHWCGSHHAPSRRRRWGAQEEVQQGGPQTIGHAQQEREPWHRFASLPPADIAAPHLQETREGGGVPGTGVLDAPPDRMREAVSRRRAAELRGSGEQFPTRAGAQVAHRSS